MKGKSGTVCVIPGTGKYLFVFANMLQVLFPSSFLNLIANVCEVSCVV